MNFSTKMNLCDSHLYSCRNGTIFLVAKVPAGHQ